MDFADYMASLPDNHVDALSKICSDFFNFHAEHKAKYGANTNAWLDFKKHEYQLYFKMAYKLLTHFEIDFVYDDTTNTNHGVVNFFDYFQLKVSELFMDQTFERKFIKNKDSITLTKEEIVEIQTKIDALRKTLSAADYIEAKHKRRILMRLEKFQSEIHKAISDLDIFKAGWSEVNDMLEDTGKKAKPIVDRFNEIFSITKKKDPLLIGNDEAPKQIEDKSGEDEVE